MKENIIISEYLEDISNFLSSEINNLIDTEIEKLEKGEKLDDLDLIIIYKLLQLSKKD